ncbi:MAG: hypothetical protein ACXWIW_09765 [Croceibacterium sp.]
MVRFSRQTTRRTTALLWLMPLAACATAPTTPPSAHRPAPAPRQHPRNGTVPPTKPAPPPKQAFRPPEIQHLPGLENVIDRDAAALVREFGNPQLDVHEGDMRKLQFSGEACVLDIYLYPLHPGSDPLATYVDARRSSDGLDVDRAACIAALMKVRP